MTNQSVILRSKTATSNENAIDLDKDIRLETSRVYDDIAETDYVKVEPDIYA